MTERRSLSRPGLGWLNPDCPASRSCLVSQPFPLGALDRQIGALHVIDAQPNLMRVAEVELTQVAVQVGFRHMEIHAVDAPLTHQSVM